MKPAGWIGVLSMLAAATLAACGGIRKGWGMDFEGSDIWDREIHRGLCLWASRVGAARSKIVSKIFRDGVKRAEAAMH